MALGFCMSNTTKADYLYACRADCISRGPMGPFSSLHLESSEQGCRGVSLPMPGNAFCPSGSQAELSSQGQLTGTVLWEGCSPSQRDPDLNSSSFVTAADPLVMAWSTQRFLASRAHCRSVCLGPCRANACAYMPCSLVPQFWEALCMHFIVS